MKSLFLGCALAVLSTSAFAATPSTITDPAGINKACVNSSGQLCVTSTQTAVAPASLANTSVGTGGSSVIIVSGGSVGGYVTNPPTATSQGLAAAENLYVDYANTPGSTDATCSGTCTILQPGQTYGWPSLTAGVTIKVNAASNGHLFSGAK